MSAIRGTAEIIQLPRRADGKRIEIVKQVRAGVFRKVSTLLENLSVNGPDALFEEMHHLNEEAALECHFNIMRSLKTESKLLRQNFAVQMNKSWSALAHGRDKQAVEDAPHDVTPMLKAYSDRYLNHYKILLEELRRRCSRLVGTELAFHPLLPGNFYLSFWHATEDLDLTYQERKLLLPLFHRFVMDRFGQILSVANQTLIELDIPADGE